MGANVSRIEVKNLEFHEKIGEGGYGLVKRVTFKKSFKGYKEAAAKSVFEVGEQEVKVMIQLDYKHIVHLLGVCHNEVGDLIIMEYAPNGSLHDYLKDKSKPLPYELQKKWAKEAALAIQYLHRRNFLHRDIKPQNCLLFDDDLLKLCDFGLAREIEASQTTSSQKGTHRYMAPELHRGNERGRAVFSKPSDIYAYGMLVLAICARKPPFEELEWHKVIFEVGGGAKPSIPEDCPTDLSDVVKLCWHTEPKQRATIGFIVDVLCDWFLETDIRLEYQGTRLEAYTIACCPNGDIIVNGGTRGGKLYILDREGKYKMALSVPSLHTPIGNVVGIAISPLGHILVMESTKWVNVFDLQYKYLHRFDTLTPKYDKNTVSLVCIAVDKEGQVLLGACNNSIVTIRKFPDGKVVHKVTCPMIHGTRIVVNSKNQILFHHYVVGYSKVVAIDYSGNEVFSFTPKIDVDVSGEVVWPGGIVCDEEDNIYITIKVFGRANTAHIHKYSPTGAFLHCIARGLNWPRSLSFSPDGSLVVANAKSILKYTRKEDMDVRLTLDTSTSTAPKVHPYNT